MIHSACRAMECGRLSWRFKKKWNKTPQVIRVGGVPSLALSKKKWNKTQQVIRVVSLFLMISIKHLESRLYNKQVIWRTGCRCTQLARASRHPTRTDSNIVTMIVAVRKSSPAVIRPPEPVTTTTSGAIKLTSFNSERLGGRVG